MASIQFGFGVDGVRGSIRGTTFQGGRSSFIVRGKPISPKRNSTAQNTYRQTYQTLSQTWRTLSTSDRSAWEATAAGTTWFNSAGDGYNPSGFMLYMKTNLIIRSSGGTAITVPPTPTLMPVLAVASIAANSGANTITISWTVTPIPANIVLHVQASPVVSAGRSYRNARYRIIRTFAPGTTSTQNVASFYSSAFGEWRRIGSKIQWRLWFANRLTGETTVVQVVDSIIT